MKTFVCQGLASNDAIDLVPAPIRLTLKWIQETVAADGRLASVVVVSRLPSALEDVYRALEANDLVGAEIKLDGVLELFSALQAQAYAAGRYRA